jgi:hypothetical protein
MSSAQGVGARQTGWLLRPSRAERWSCSFRAEAFFNVQRPGSRGTSDGMVVEAIASREVVLFLQRWGIFQCPAPRESGDGMAGEAIASREVVVFLQR